MNLAHMKLFHSFQTYTMQTLLGGPQFWEHALRLSFEVDFVMNAMLCIAARHLVFLRPEDGTNLIAARRHLSRALSRFRHGLSQNLSPMHLDPFLITSILLQYEIWNDTDLVLSQDDVSNPFDHPRDRIFPFCSSMKRVLLENISRLDCQSSAILPYIQQSPLEAVTEVAQVGDHTLAMYRDFFSYRCPLTLDLLNTPFPCRSNPELHLLNKSALYAEETPELRDGGYELAVARLCLIMSFLPEARPHDPIGPDSPLLPTLARYILSFPVMCHGTFAMMVQRGDPHVLFLLYHFYRTVRILLPLETFWWAYEQAYASETALREWLIRKIHDTDMERLNQPGINATDKAKARFHLSNIESPELTGEPYIV